METNGVSGAGRLFGAGRNNSAAGAGRSEENIKKSQEERIEKARKAYSVIGKAVSFLKKAIRNFTNIFASAKTDEDDLVEIKDMEADFLSPETRIRNKLTIKPKNTGAKTQDADKNKDETYEKLKTGLDNDPKLGVGFSAKVEQVAKNINCDAKDLIGIMEAESGLDPQISNGGSAVGLTQFTRYTDEITGISHSEILNMSGVQQLDYVEKFFLHCKKEVLGVDSDYKLSAADLYALNYRPYYATNEVVCSKADGADYEQNVGLDINGDGYITREELAERVRIKYQEAVNKYT